MQLFITTRYADGTLIPAHYFYSHTKEAVGFFWFVYSFCFVFFWGGVGHWTEHVFSKMGGIYQGKEGDDWGIGDTSQ